MPHTELKKQISKSLGLFVAAHALVFGWLILDAPVSVQGLASLSALEFGKAAIGFISILFALALRDGIDSHKKAVLVYGRRTHPLPGSRAFSDLLKRPDSRVNLERLLSLVGGAYPTSRADQNAKWYELYQEHESAPSVRTTQRDWLLWRDLTWLGLLLTLPLGFLALIFSEATIAALAYVAVFSSFQVAAWNAARLRGESFVMTVLAVASAAHKPAGTKA